MRSKLINNPVRTPLRAALLAGATALLLAAGSGPAWADVIFGTPSGSTAASNSVSASADFAISGDTLTITLTNVSATNSSEAPGSTLSGISFLLNGTDPSLTPVSAISPNAIVNPGQCDVTSCPGTNVNVDGEWGYQQSYGSKEGIGSSGYITTGLSHGIGNFNNGSAGTDLASPKSLDGINFGIISNNHGALNGGLSSTPLIMNDVVLTLSGVSNFTGSDIGSVTFLYGTSSSEASIDGTCTAGCGGNPVGPPSVPEPGSLALLGTGLLGLGLAMRRRRRS